MLWLPAVPLLFVTLLAYVVHMLRGIQQDLRQLRAQRYHFRQA
jgi:hypothetical protein